MEYNSQMVRLPNPPKQTSTIWNFHHQNRDWEGIQQICSHLTVQLNSLNFVFFCGTLLWAIVQEATNNFHKQNCVNFFICKIHKQLVNRKKCVHKGSMFPITQKCSSSFYMFLSFSKFQCSPSSSHSFAPPLLGPFYFV